MVRLRQYWIYLAAVLSITGAPASANDMKTAIQTVHQCRRELTRILDYVEEHPELFPAEKQKGKRVLTRKQRMQIWTVWQQLLDQIAALDRVGARAANAYRKSKGDERKAAFRISFAAFLAQYRHALDFIAVSENAREMHTVLNEPVAELGLTKDSYAEFKFRFLNVILGTEFARLCIVYKFYGDDPDLILTEGIEADKDVIWDAGKGPGPLETAKNGLQIARDTSFDLWFPVQKGVSDWMGDTKVWRQNESLITADQVKTVRQKLKPGDVLLVRHEWYMSNIGLPGFWPHAALYIGTPDERNDFFAHPEVKAWIQKQDADCDSLEQLLRKRYPEKYKKSRARDDDGHSPLILEAISEGVSFTTLNHCLDADSTAVLRPLVPPAVKARAILRAFHYSGRPYDFNFDFLTDAALVCTELVYKSYEADKELGGLDLPTVDVLGRPVLPANELAKLFVSERRTDKPQFKFILFLDGFERGKVAVEKDIEAFAESVTRPKWHIWIQDKPETD